MRPLTRCAIVAGASAAFLVPAGPARAEIELTASYSPAAVSGPPPWTAGYRLDVASGDLGALFYVFVADGHAGAAKLSEEITGGGAAVVTPSAFGSSSGPVVPDRYSPGGVGPCLDHGTGEGAFSQALVALPPRSTGFVETGQTLAIPPWPGDSLAFRFRIEPAPLAPGFATVPEVRDIALDGPALDVDRGVRIDFGSPRPRYADDTFTRSATTTVREGSRVPVRGSVSPSLRGDRIRLVESRRPAGKRRLVARARIGRHGRFRYRGWAPTGRGAHYLNAVYRVQREGVARSRTRCGPVVILR